MHTVQLHFDFVSPYSYLALARCPVFAREHSVEWDLRPVLYARLLEASGRLGPVEVDRQREYTFRDVVRCADQLGVPIEGPPEHPFRSLEALRAVWLFEGDPRAVDLAVGLARAAWAEGRDLRDWGVIEEQVRAAGLDAVQLPERCGWSEVKERLRAATEEAIASGVFGVPTFAWNGELFWGADRMDALAARLRGELADPEDRARAMLARPIGVVRRRREVAGS